MQNYLFLIRYLVPGFRVFPARAGRLTGTMGAAGLLLSALRGSIKLDLFLGVGGREEFILGSLIGVVDRFLGASNKRYAIPKNGCFSGDEMSLVGRLFNLFLAAARAAVRCGLPMIFFLF